jgi:hypothetical protein
MCSLFKTNVAVLIKLSKQGELVNFQEIIGKAIIPLFTHVLNNELMHGILIFRYSLYS